jgi:hypothetical protein
MGFDGKNASDGINATGISARPNTLHDKTARKSGQVNSSASGIATPSPAWKKTGISAREQTAIEKSQSPERASQHAEKNCKKKSAERSSIRPPEGGTDRRPFDGSLEHAHAAEAPRPSRSLDVDMFVLSEQIDESKGLVSIDRRRGLLY